MVEKAIALTEETVEKVAREAGEVSIETAEERLSRGELDDLRRRALAGDLDEPVWLVRMEGPEREMVREAASEAGMQPGEWLSRAFDEVAGRSYPSVEAAFERAIFTQY